MASALLVAVYHAAQHGRRISLHTISWMSKHCTCVVPKYMYQAYTCGGKPALMKVSSVVGLKSDDRLNPQKGSLWKKRVMIVLPESSAGYYFGTICKCNECKLSYSVYLVRGRIWPVYSLALGLPSH
jgi:hypothetical protein